MSPAKPLRRRTAFRRACKTTGVPRYAADLVLTRGRCQHGRCKGRWAVTRVSLDFRFDWVERIAILECASCGRTWRRVRVPPLRSPAGYQAVALTLILPGTARRWTSRGRWKREGDDATIIRDADLGDADEAAREQAKRLGTKLAAKERRKAREEAETAALMARLREAEAAAQARREAREQDEREAQAREAMMAR